MNRLALGLTLISVLVTFGVGSANAATPVNKVYDGSAFKAIPTTLSGWNIRGLRDTKIVGITWRGWNSKRAIGVGTAINQGCRDLPCGLATENDLSVWTNKQVRVTAYRPRDGAYQRLRVFQWTAWNKERRKQQLENYHFTVAFLGQGASLPWRVIDLDQGLR